MALQSFLALVGGRFSRVFPIQASTGVASAGAIPALNAAGAIDVTMLPTGVGPDTTAAVASEAIAANAQVNIWNNSGVVSVRNANGATGLEVHGFVLAAVASGANATVYMSGLNTGMSGLTPGADYWLSDVTAGGATMSPPTLTGHFSQQIGTAVSASALQFQPGALIAL